MSCFQVFLDPFSWFLLRVLLNQEKLTLRCQTFTTVVKYRKFDPLCMKYICRFVSTDSQKHSSLSPSRDIRYSAVVFVTKSFESKLTEISCFFSCRCLGRRPFSIAKSGLKGYLIDYKLLWTFQVLIFSVLLSYYRSAKYFFFLKKQWR